MRFYKNKFPIIGECLMVKCINISTIGVLCHLLEYDNIEALIPSTELSKQRLRSITQVTAVGRIFVSTVINVDEEKGYIDLSKKRVNEEDINECEERFAKSKKVNTIIKSITKKLNDMITEQELYENLVWKFPENEHALDVLYSIYKDRTLLNRFQIPTEVGNALLEILDKYLATKDLHFQSEIEITCYDIEGIEAIKKCLKEGMNMYEGVKIRLLKSPTYTIDYISSDKNKGLRVLQEVAEKIGLEIRKYKNSDFLVTVPGKIMNEEENKKIKMRIQEAIFETEEVDGDDDISE